MPTFLGNDGLVLPDLAAAPAATRGEFFFDRTLGRARLYDGTQWQDQSVVDDLSPGLLAPADFGLKAMSYDPGRVEAAGTLATGNVRLIRIPVPRTITVASLVIYIGTAGAALTAGQSRAGIYTSAGVLIAQTADMSTAWTTVGEKVMALTVVSGQSLTLSGSPTAYVFGAVYSVGTTPPAFGRPALGLDAALMNRGRTGFAVRAGSHGTATTTLPATLTAGTITQSNSWLWMGLL